MPRMAGGFAPHSPPLDASDRTLLFGLQCRALRYFLDNQTISGLVLDRQANHGPRRAHGLCSLAATGMGFVALALASDSRYGLLSRRTAARRIATGLATALDQLPHDRGIVPHFVHSANGAVHGDDALSTVESSWLVAGGLWAAAFLRDGEVISLASQLYERIDWSYWAGSSGLLRHGQKNDGRFLPCCWDRLNGETAFMYVLACGAAEGQALGAESWRALKQFSGTAGGHRFNNADLGLFVFQYGLDLLDLRRWRRPGDPDLWAEAATATLANEAVCRAAASEFATYRRFWGLSAGDGPPERRGEEYAYRPYAPSGPLDGTAHLTATLASVAHHPTGVLRNLHEARRYRELLGRYGFSNLNLDRGWMARDMVGIDAGAAVLALDNYLMADRVRDVFHELPCVRRGLERLEFVRAEKETVALRRAS
jgi:hypothetical protein